MACSVASKSSAVTLEDCTCPICMCILIQPVTMPCQHELCMPCFKQNVEEASLTCPMCRNRIATWARLSTKQNKLVNETRWKQIQTLFPEKVKRRLEGKEDEDDDEDMLETFNNPIKNIAQPGEIRKEYEEQVKMLQQERQAERSKEEEESAMLIERLQEEEEERQRLLQQEAEEQKSRDEEFAKQLSQRIAETSIDEVDIPGTPETLSGLSRTSSSSSNGLSTLDYFVKQTSITSNGSSSKADSERNIVASANNFEDSDNMYNSRGYSSGVSNRPTSNGVPHRDLTLSEKHRQFVRNQFTVMSKYTDSGKPRSETITSTASTSFQTTSPPVMDVVLSHCDSTTDDDDSLSSEPKLTPLIPLEPIVLSDSEDININTSVTHSVNPGIKDHVPKKVVGLFPQEAPVTFSDKSVKKNRSILSDDEEETAEEEITSDINANNNSSQTSVKGKTKGKKSTTKDISPILSPQRSIRDWFSASDNLVKGHGTKSKRLSKLSPKKIGSRKNVISKTTVKRVGKRNIVSTLSQSVGKNKPNSPRKTSRKSSKHLQFSEDEDLSVPLKESFQNSDETDLQNIISKTKSMISEPHAPSPPKRRKKQVDSILEEEENENSDVFVTDNISKGKNIVSRGDEDTRRYKSKTKTTLESSDNDAHHSVTQNKKTIASKNKPLKSTSEVLGSEGKNKAEIKGKDHRKSKMAERKTDFESQSDSEFDEDMRLALKLQREFDMEAKLARQVDRSKGSESEYMLRHSTCTSPGRDMSE